MTTPPLDAATAYLRRGWQPVPVPYRTKGPNLPGWQNLRLTEAELPRHFNGAAQNVGVLLGEPSRGLVDVDLDAPEAVAAAAALLPDTACVSGRASRPRTHCWYIADEPPARATIPHRDPTDGAVLVELRSTTGQTLAPPSVHPEGDAYLWHAFGKPARVAIGDLRRAVRHVAAAALLAKHWPERGSRQALALPLAGFVLRGGLDVDTAARLVRVAAEAAGDDEAGKREQAVRDTAATLTAGRPATGAPTLEGLLDVRIIAALGAWLELRAPARSVPAAGAGGRDVKETQATALVRLAGETYTFHMSEAGEPYAVRKSGPPIAHMLRGGRESLRAALAVRYAAEHDRAPSAAALADAMLVIEGRCLTAPRGPLHLRLARTGDAIVLDLGRPDGQVAITRPGGWEVGPTPAGIIWRRTELTGELPLPSLDGSLDGLRDLLNVTADGWLLVRGALVAALIPDIPHPVLLFRGPQGSAKSWAARIWAGLIDSSAAALRAPPARPDDWQVAAGGSWVVTLDNISIIPPWLSDAICRASTGDGLVKRRLYSDDSLVVLSYRRVVALTTIDAGALRGDLADRLLSIELERIPPERRRLDTDVAAAFAQGHSALLGALLDLTAAVLAALPTVRLATYPRMADFGRVLAALDVVTGDDALDTYLAAGDELAGEVVEGDAATAAVAALVGEGETWQGAAGELLDAITPERPPKGWPATAHHLAGRLRRAGEALRAVGVAVSFERQPGTGRRVVKIERVGKSASQASQASRLPEPESAGCDAEAGAAAEASQAASHPGAAGTAPPGLQSSLTSDSRDAVTLRDADLPTLSIGTEVCSFTGCTGEVDVFDAGGEPWCARHERQREVIDLAHAAGWPRLRLAPVLVTVAAGEVAWRAWAAATANSDLDIAARLLQGGAS